jgi:hypothetical protein
MAVVFNCMLRWEESGSGRLVNDTAWLHLKATAKAAPVFTGYLHKDSDRVCSNSGHQLTIRFAQDVLQGSALRAEAASITHQHPALGQHFNIGTGLREGMRHRGRGCQG